LCVQIFPGSRLLTRFVLMKYEWGWKCIEGKIKKTLWSESATELYRPSDRCF
jgi:hypothetical protein